MIQVRILDLSTSSPISSSIPQMMLKSLHSDLCYCSDENFRRVERFGYGDDEGWLLRIEVDEGCYREKMMECCGC